MLVIHNRSWCRVLKEGVEEERIMERRISEPDNIDPTIEMGWQYEKTAELLKTLFNTFLDPPNWGVRRLQKYLSPVPKHLSFPHLTSSSYHIVGSRRVRPPLSLCLFANSAYLPRKTPHLTTQESKVLLAYIQLSKCCN